jgi:hypothetical protein
MTKKKAKKPASSTALIARIRKVKLTPIDKLEDAIYQLHKSQKVEEELSDKICEYAVDLQHGLEDSFRDIIREIQENQRRNIPACRQMENAETNLSLLIAKVCLAERLASR